MQNPKFQIFTGTNGQYYFRLRAKNGEIILASESYPLKKNCENGIASVKVNAPDDKRYVRKDATDNYTFVLTATNGEPPSVVVKTIPPVLHAIMALKP